MRLLPLPLLATLALLAGGAPADAQKKPDPFRLVIFKDGFAVRGKIQRPHKIEFDKSGFQFTVPTGHFYIDDDVRYILFSPNQVHELVEEDSSKKAKPIRLGNTWIRAKGDAMPPEWTILDTGEVNNRLERVVRIGTSRGYIDVKQRLITLTPRYVRFQSHQWAWMPCYFTREFGPEKARDFVYRHMTMMKKPAKDFDRREQVYRFLLQAGWTEQAERELDNLIDRFPKERERLMGYKNGLERLTTAQFVEGIEQAHKVGQHQQAQERLARYHKLKLFKLAPDGFAEKAQAIKNYYATADQKLKDARRFLGVLPRKATPLQSDFFKEAAEAILAGLNCDTVGRLETFITQAQDWERALKATRAPSCNPEELLSFAVSGWLLGDGAAERSVPTARTLWKARQLVLDSQRNADPFARKQRAAAFAKDKNVTVDLIARMIPLLPPPEPYEKPDVTPIQLTTPEGGISYHVQLPPEYHPYRAYPVLIALHHTAEKAEDELTRWAELAAKYGFIVMAPEWGRGGKDLKYQYSAREHAAVLFSLRDLRRRFQVDSDRVFLFGSEQGGTMAYDVGLAHPDQFAGVLPMCASPLFYPFRYTTNAQYLPFYVVNGEYTGMLARDNRLLFKDWIRWNYPTLMVEYKGRATEFFSAELEPMMDWMSRKKRANPLRQLGQREGEFRTMRETDTRFYWLSTDRISPSHLNTFQAWVKTRQPATMWAQIAQNNVISIRTQGLDQVTVWLGPGMVNYGEQVKLNLNLSPLRARTVTPSLDVMLDELARTGDRQRLFWAAIPITIR